MATFSTTLVPSCLPMAGGVTATPGIGGKTLVVFGGQFVAGDRIFLNATEAATGFSYVLCAGLVTGKVPSFVFTYKQKVYFLAGTSLYFSAIDLPTSFNQDYTAGNGYEDLSNMSGTAENLVAIGSYQGRLSIFSRLTSQIWSVDPDPSLNNLLQTLENVGTVAKLSVKGIGELDLYFLSDSGFRSIRPRDASSNATTYDVGTPIDTMMQGILSVLSDSNKAVSCATVEPLSNRYWCFVKGSGSEPDAIYVFSNFSQSGVNAWSRYLPTSETAGTPSAASYPSGQPIISYTVPGDTICIWTPGANEVSFQIGSTTILTSTHGAGVPVTFTSPSGSNIAYVTGTAQLAAFTGSLLYQQSFTPELFELYLGRIYVRAGDNIYLYGGSSGNVYDYSVASFETFWMDGKSPSTKKISSGMDFAFTGAWKMKFGMDYVSQTLEPLPIYDAAVASYDGGRIPITINGTHLKVTGETTGTVAATFDAITILFSEAETT